jgi:hypothetical protein
VKTNLFVIAGYRRTTVARAKREEYTMSSDCRVCACKCCERKKQEKQLVENAVLSRHSNDVSCSCGASSAVMAVCNKTKMFSSARSPGNGGAPGCGWLGRGVVGCCCGYAVTRPKTRPGPCARPTRRLVCRPRDCALSALLTFSPPQSPGSLLPNLVIAQDRAGLPLHVY